MQAHYIGNNALKFKTKMKYPYMLTRTAKKQKKSIASITINSEIITISLIKFGKNTKMLLISTVFNIALEMAGNTT